MNNQRWQPMPRFLLRKNAFKNIIKKYDFSNKTALEIGFGAGEILKLMSDYNNHITGYDFSSNAVKLARKRIAQHRKSSLINITDDAQSLHKNHYDIVIAFEVLEHIEEDLKALKEWLSYVKPGGSLVISVPAHQSKWCKNDVWAGHVKRYEKQDLLDLCQQNQCSVKNLWNYGYPLTIVLDKLLDRIRDTDKETQTSHEEKITLTQKSGIDRDNKWIYRALSNDIALWPFYQLQKLFFNKDLGSGFLLHVIKND